MMFGLSGEFMLGPVMLMRQQNAIWECVQNLQLNVRNKDVN